MEPDYCINCGSEELSEDNLTGTLICLSCGFEFTEEEIQEHIINHQQ